jgi:hypothetical protein
VGRRLEFVVFAWVDDEFGGPAEAVEGLIHQLCAQDENVPLRRYGW